MAGLAQPDGSFHKTAACRWWRLGTLLASASLSLVQVSAADLDLAAGVTNQLGIELQRKLATGDENLCLSPYSIQSALAMTFAGAESETRTEMAEVLHYPNQDVTIHVAFAALRQALDETAKSTAKIVENSKKTGGPSEPIRLNIANRLFAQNGYDFRDTFRALVQRYYGAPFEALDFKKNPDSARQRINKWVAEQTRERIRDLIPPNGLNNTSRLVLANALYFKAGWASEFSESATQPKPFRVRGGAEVAVPTMYRKGHFGYAKRDGFIVIGIPYVGSELQLLILLPNDPKGLRAFESKLTADVLAQAAKLPDQELNLYLPKFKLEPATMPLGKALQELGMKSAFDQPVGSANFDRIALRKPDDYLYISEVFHKTFIAVDEKGTEAAAATAVSMMAGTAMIKRPEPIEVKVDRPFVFAIQHVTSGACLFLGRVTDPR